MLDLLGQTWWQFVEKDVKYEAMKSAARHAGARQAAITTLN
jgi:hypothetical protein